VAKVIWTDPALDQLEEIADYIALDKPGAASGLVKTIFSVVERLEQFPDSGHVPAEFPDSVYCELYVRPCRIFYRREEEVVLIVHVMREERQLRRFLLDPEMDSEP
jgi:toxin ParE1/3/4